jgi:hypothetical protein
MQKDLNFFRDGLIKEINLYSQKHKRPDRAIYSRLIYFKKKGKGKKQVPLVHVYIGLLADNVRKTATNTFDGGKSKHNLLFAINVGVQNTKNVLEFLICYKSLSK